MSLPDASRRAAHVMLDIVLAQTGDASGDQKAAASSIALRAFDDVLQGEWITTVPGEDGGRHLRFDLDPIIWGPAAVIRWLVYELAACAGISEEEVIGHARGYVEAEAQRPPS